MNGLNKSVSVLSVLLIIIIVCNTLRCFFDCIEVKNMSFDHNKTAPKKRKKQLPAKEMGEERRSTLSIRFAIIIYSQTVTLFHSVIQFLP